MRTKRLKFLSQYFFPEHGATSELLSEIAFKLSENGYTVQAVAGQPSYLGSSKIPKIMDHRGMKIKRVWSTTLSKDKVLGRVLNSLTFTLSACWNVLLTPRSTILFVVTNPPSLPWVCCLGHFIRNHRYVVIVHDVYPDIAVRLKVLSRSSPITKIWDAFNRITYRRAKKIVVLGRDMKALIERKVNSNDTNKITVIENWADGQKIYPIPRENNDHLENMDIKDKFVVLYSGNIGLFHEVDTILQAAARLSQLGFIFLFIGTGAQVSNVEKKLSHCDNIRLIPFQPREQLGKTLTACDVGLVTLRENLGGLSVPSKLYGLLAAGKPIVVVGPPDCETARVVQKSECGLVINPGDVDGLVQAFRQLRDNPNLCREMGKNARQMFTELYDLPVIINKWEYLLDEITSR